MTRQHGDLIPGSEHEGFRLERSVDLPNLRATAHEFEHLPSGARLLHLHADDTENCFAVIFPTPPPDDTGLPHILEHSVLAGSQKYPVREPFFEILKMSTATFINAMTSQAFTIYPIATTVKQDFFNLVDVYLDAVFHPLLAESTFRREGHHLSLVDNEDLESPLTIAGIVYSEMRGAWSMPETLLWNLGVRGLCPQTPLGRDSGGDPQHIPELTYEQFKSFYEHRYHPANARIFIYGDIPTREHLAFLAPLLDGFERSSSDVPAPRQPRWGESRRIEQAYPLGPGEDPANRTYVTLTWLVGDATDPAEVMDWSVLATLLFGNEAAPLKKAIIDSKLGADLHSSGECSDAYELAFGVGLKGSEAERADAFVSLVLEALESIAAAGIPRTQVEAAFHQVAYEHLEVETLFPLRMLELCAAAWPYGGDPLTFMRMDKQLADCRARYESDPALFGRLIGDRLLNNPHRLLVVLRPDAEVQARADQVLTAHMAARRAGLDAPRIAEIASEAAALGAEQTKPNSPEAVATLPQLRTEDLPDSPRRIPTEVTDTAGITLLHNEVFANGVNYLQVDVDLAGLSPELYAWLPRFCEAISKMGADGENFEQIAARRAACTGGLTCSTPILRHATDPARCLRRVSFGLKTLDDQAHDALDLLGRLMFGLDPRDTERMRDVLTQAQASYRTGLVNGALQTARRHAARGLTPEAAMDYLFCSRETLHLVDGLLDSFDRRADELMTRIEQIRDFLPGAGRWTVSFTGSDRVFDTVQQALQDWASRRRHAALVDAPPPFVPFSHPPREGLAAPLQVAHCAKTMPAPSFAHPETPLFELGLYLAQFDYLLPEIRLKGNAYGAGAMYDNRRGTLSLFSFRDPRIVETLAVFDGLRDFVDRAAWTQTDVDRGIIGLAKKIVQPIRPGQATGEALMCHVRGESDELRERQYAATRRATPGEIKRVLLAQLEAGESKAGVCVAAGNNELEAANRALGSRALEISGILG